MKNKLSDLNNHLFAQMERLSDEDLQGEKLQQEVVRSYAVSRVAKNIISNADLVLKAERCVADGHIIQAPAMLGLDQK